METPDPWERLDALLNRIWYRADGRPFEVMAVCIDSGGHHTQKVYDFSKARLGRKVWAIKGESAVNGRRNPVWPIKKPTRKTKASFRPVIIGVNAAKDTIRNRLHLDQAGAGYMHFPNDRDIGYFEQLTSERSVVKKSGGQTFRVWELPSGRANEALDCRVYAYAALCGLTHLGLKLNRRADLVAVPLEFDQAQQSWAPPREAQPEAVRAAPASPVATSAPGSEKPARKRLTNRLA